MALAFISHQAPHHETESLSLLQRRTIARSGDRGRSAPASNQVFVLLPNQIVTLQRGVFKLQERRADDRNPATVSLFFSSAAEDLNNFAVGTVLSGADGDGPRV